MTRTVTRVHEPEPLQGSLSVFVLLHFGEHRVRHLSDCRYRITPCSIEEFVRNSTAGHQLGEYGVGCKKCRHVPVLLGRWKGGCIPELVDRILDCPLDLVAFGLFSGNPGCIQYAVVRKSLYECS